MRILFAVPLLALAACNVDANNADNDVGISLNTDALENGAEAAAAKAGEVAKDAANEAKEAGAEVKNQVERLEVDVDSEQDRAASNAATNNL